MRILLKGSKGEDVRAAQAALNFYAEDGDEILATDADFGNKTHNRTVQFQKENNLFPDGKIGPNTGAVLFRCRTVFLSTAILRRPDKSRLSFFSGSGNGAFDWSKLNLFLTPLWPTPPQPTPVLWPPLNLTLPPFPGLGFPAPLPPRLVLNAPLSQGQTLVGPPPVFSPFHTPSAQLFLFKFSVLSKEKNLKVSSEIEPLQDDDGTFKVEGFVKSQLDIVKGPHLTASLYLKAKAEAGLSPMTGKAVGSTGVNFSFFGGVLDVGSEFKFLKIESDPAKIVAKPLFIGGSVTAHF